MARRESWPRLAWIARCAPDGGIEVEAGSGVHVAPDWFGEIVWDGPFEEADFDRTELAFGSGCRIRSDAVVFVSAGQTADRLHSIEVDGGAWLVSNSLPCLLAKLGASLDAGVDYRPPLMTIRRGIRSYDQLIPSTAGEVRLTYFQNLRWDGSALERVEKPAPHRDLPDYDRYRRLMTDVTQRLVDNARHVNRRVPLQPVSTCSAGYDSSAVTVLVSEAGGRRSVGLLQTRNRTDDSGAAVAEALGIDFSGFESRQWVDRGVAEARFLAAGVGGGSSIPLLAAEETLADSVLFTGYHGDKMWDLNPKGLSADHPRADLGGCDLMEFRLSAGFVHVMLPMFASNQMVDVHRISAQDEMRPWRIGGAYDRPIPRRIVEQAGVPRGAFAREKGAMQQWVVFTPEAQEAFRDWIAALTLDRDSTGSNEVVPAAVRFQWAVSSVRDRYYR